MRLGARLRSGEGIGWLAAGTIITKLFLLSALLFFSCVFCYCSFLFVVFVLFLCFFALVGALYMFL